MKSVRYFLAILSLTGALTLSARGTFIIDPDPGGEKVSIDKTKSDFKEFAGANNSSAPNVASTPPAPFSSDFKEIKQIEFSLAGGHAVPDSGPTAMLLGGGLAAIVLVRRYLKR